MAGVSTGKNNASARPGTIEKADAAHKRDLFALFGTALLDLQRDNVTLRFGGLAEIQRNLLVLPIARERVGSNKHDVRPIQDFHLPGLISRYDTHYRERS